MIQSHNNKAVAFSKLAIAIIATAITVESERYLTIAKKMYSAAVALIAV